MVYQTKFFQPYQKLLSLMLNLPRQSNKHIYYHKLLLGEFAGVSNLYDGITYVIEKYDTAWRYLMFIMYFISYAIFGLIILGVLKAYDGLKYR